MRISERAYRILIKLVITVIILVAVGTVAFLALQISGKNRLYQRSDGRTPLLDQAKLTDAEGTSQTSTQTEEMEDWREGDVRYQGVHYRYNEDILTFLFLGIDEMGEVEKRQEGIQGGQSDAMFLMVLDSHKKEISIIGINRDTMTDIAVYNDAGSYMGTVQAQLTLQHGYGDGAQLSCERTRDAVERLFYGLPIHGYFSLNMGAIPLINDAVGGVEVTAIEDVPGANIKEGDTLVLNGEQAYAYLHNRDITRFNSAGMRLKRQKQYLTAYAQAAMEAMKSDLSLPVKLYASVSKYMVTDITVDEVSYLASQALGYSFDDSRFYFLEGDTVQGEEVEEFYPNQEALYELILEVFYEEAETSS